MRVASIQTFNFNNSEGIDELVIRYNSDEQGDEIVPETYLEIIGLAEGDQVSAIGYVLGSEDGVAMSFADISGIGTAEVVEKDGIYLILSSSLQRLELQSSGDCKVIVKQVA